MPDIDLTKTFEYIKNTRPPTINIVDVGVLRGSFYYDMQKHLRSPKTYDKSILNIPPAFWVGIEPDIYFPHIKSLYDSLHNVAVCNVQKPEKRTFYINSDRGISSLMKINKEYFTSNPDERENKWYIPSHVVADNIIEEREVDVVSMKYIFDSIPKFSNEDIHFVKIDAQGAHISVVESMKDYLSRTMFIMIESVMTKNPDAVLYKGQTNSEHDISVMENLGFEIYTMLDYSNHLGPDSGLPYSSEADIVFINKEFKK